MRKFTAVVILALVVWSVGAQTARAGSPYVRTATIDPRSGAPVSVVTRLQPVVGSVQRTSHFTHPFTHKAKYTNTVYNPVLGTFSTQKFKR